LAYLKILAERAKPLAIRYGPEFHQPAFSGLVHREADRVGAHSAGEAAEERVRGKFQRQRQVAG